MNFYNFYKNIIKTLNSTLIMICIQKMNHGKKAFECSKPQHDPAIVLRLPSLIPWLSEPDSCVNVSGLPRITYTKRARKTHVSRKSNAEVATCILSKSTRLIERIKCHQPVIVWLTLLSPRYTRKNVSISFTELMWFWISTVGRYVLRVTLYGKINHVFFFSLSMVFDAYSMVLSDRIVFYWKCTKCRGNEIFKVSKISVKS